MATKKKTPGIRQKNGAGRAQVGFTMKPEIIALAKMAAAMTGQRHGAFIEDAVIAAVVTLEKERGIKIPRPEGLER